MISKQQADFIKQPNISLQYLQAISITIQLKKHFSHSSLIFLQANDSFLFWNKK